MPNLGQEHCGRRHLFGSAALWKRGDASVVLEEIRLSQHATVGMIARSLRLDPSPVCSRKRAAALRFNLAERPACPSTLTDHPRASDPLLRSLKPLSSSCREQR